jgi:phenylacetate-CoA ligase
MNNKLLSQPVKLQSLLKRKPEKFWLARGEKMALELFRQMSQRVPAYVDFLAKNNFDPKTVKKIEHFKNIPIIDKDNYLRAYPLEMLCWDGDFKGQPWVISSTSGSTGEPFYFPRSSLQDEFYSVTAEIYLRENFQIDKKSTLYIDAFAMGAWIGGVFTYEAVNRVAKKGYPLSIITPGINKAEVISSVRRLGPNFDQVIIGCYPPILKDIIDLGIEEGLDWAKYNLGVVFSAEGFSEEFRDYIIQKASLANAFTSTLNHYGTVDLGTMSHETPLSILMRRQAVNNKALMAELFPRTHKQPTFTQYLPEMFFFEEVDGQLFCSSYSGLPLVRYDLKDNGGVLNLSEAERKYKAHGLDLHKEAKVAGIDQHTWRLPFVYLYERSDFSVTLIGGNIYPEEIRKALLDKRLHGSLTGKFSMEIINDKKMDNKLVIHVELRKDVKSSAAIRRVITASIVDVLLRENSEYLSNYSVYGKKLWPQIKLWPHEHPLHFSGRGKQRWVVKP